MKIKDTFDLSIKNNDDNLIKNDFKKLEIVINIAIQFLNVVVINVD